MKKIVLLIVLPLLLGCKSQMEKTVKEGHFDACKKATVEKLIENYFADPKWESFIADDGKYHINVTGKITFNNKPAKALLQFYIYEDDERWEVNAFEINGKPQQDLMVVELIEDMCNEYKE